MRKKKKPAIITFTFENKLRTRDTNTFSFYPPWIPHGQELLKMRGLLPHVVGSPSWCSSQSILPCISTVIVVRVLSSCTQQVWVIFLILQMRELRSRWVNGSSKIRGQKSEPRWLCLKSRHLWRKLNLEELTPNVFPVPSIPRSTHNFTVPKDLWKIFWGKFSSDALVTQMK